MGSYWYVDVTADAPIFDGPRIPEVTEQAGRPNLNRWSRGDDKPIKVSSRIVAADW